MFCSAARAEILRCAKDDKYFVAAVFIARFSVTQSFFVSFNFLLELETRGTDRSVCATWQLLGFGPGAEGAAEVDELAEVIGIVVGEDEGFAQNGLALAVGDFGVEIGARIFDELNHFAQIVFKGFDGFVPLFFARRDRGLRPVAFGKFGRDVRVIAAKFQNVPLGDADVFEELPPRVREALRVGAALGCGEAFDGVHEMDVGAAALQQGDELFAQSYFLFAHWFSGRRAFAAAQRTRFRGGFGKILTRDSFQFSAIRVFQLTSPVCPMAPKKGHLARWGFVSPESDFDSMLKTHETFAPPSPRLLPFGSTREKSGAAISLIPERFAASRKLDARPSAKSPPR